MLSLSGVTFVLFVLFVSFSYFLLLLKTQSFVQSFFVLRYACAQTVTRSYHCLRPFYLFIFLSLGILLFPSIFVPLLVPFSLCNGECVFSSHLFWTSSSLDVPAGVTQEEGHTGFLMHLPSAVRALIFLAKRIQQFLSLVDRKVEFCVLTI